MGKKLFWGQVAGFVFTGIFGVILHFLFDLTGGSVWVATISAVNESIWEHMKLLFVPMLVFALVERWFLSEDYHDFWCIKLFGVILGIGLIPVLYYTINGVLGMTPDWVNIAIFFVVDFVVYLLEGWLFWSGIFPCAQPKAAFFLLCLLALVFVVLTFAPPTIPLFQDPISGAYGYFSIVR